MIKTSIEKLSEEIGFDIGNSDDITQANLLNGFCEGMVNSMRPEHLEKQICFVVGKLTPKTNKILKLFIEFIELAEQNPRS
jgi:hypothetical protein